MQQVKHVIENSTRAPKEKVKNRERMSWSNSEISKSGGIINAYEAIKLAGTEPETTKPKNCRKRISRKQNWDKHVPHLIKAAGSMPAAFYLLCTDKYGVIRQTLHLHLR